MFGWRRCFGASSSNLHHLILNEMNVCGRECFRSFQGDWPILAEEVVLCNDLGNWPGVGRRRLAGLRWLEATLICDRGGMVETVG